MIGLSINHEIERKAQMFKTCILNFSSLQEVAIMCAIIKRRKPLGWKMVEAIINQMNKPMFIFQ